MEELNKKLNILREKAKEPGTDTNQFNQILDEWTAQIERLNLLKEYKDFEISKQICEMLISICLTVTRKLIRENDQIIRAGLIADLDRCKWLLTFYAKNPEDNIKSIENQIDEELENLNIKI